MPFKIRNQSAALLLLVASLAAPGCGSSKLADCRHENHLLAEQNEGLKRQLDVAFDDLHNTKAELDRTKADLAAARAGQR